MRTGTEGREEDDGYGDTVRARAEGIISNKAVHHSSRTVATA